MEKLKIIILLVTSVNKVRGNDTIIAYNGFLILGRFFLFFLIKFVL